MTTKFNVGDAVLVKGVVESICVETVNNEPIYSVRIKNTKTNEAYYIHVKEDAMKGGAEEDTKPQGEWIFKNGKYRCTACGEKAIYRYSGSLAITQTELLTQFCPNCGAKMKGRFVE